MLFLLLMKREMQKLVEAIEGFVTEVDADDKLRDWSDEIKRANEENNAGKVKEATEKRIAHLCKSEGATKLLKHRTGP